MFKEHEVSERVHTLDDNKLVVDTALSQRKCSNCGVTKTIDAYYSKGQRLDSSCKACVLRKKKKSYRTLISKSASLKKLRKNSKVLTFSEDQIEEKKADSSSVDLSHLENLLRQFTFDSICRDRGKNDEK